MEDSKILKKIKKFLPFIVIFCVLATVVVNRVLTMGRQYIASAVFEYTNDQAEEGKTVSGEPLKVEELKSSIIMSRVIEELGLQEEYSVDALISRISITEVPDADKMLRKESMLEEGEEYIYVPSKYRVSFTANNEEGQQFARQVLDELLDTYFAYYSEKYINVDYFSNRVGEIYNNNYDYLEMVEEIDKSIDETINALYKRNEVTPQYRATESEMSFVDLVEEFSYIDKITVNSLYADIYQYQVTKNKDVLVANYTDRIDHNNIEGTKELSAVADLEQLIDAYVTKMRNSNNTNITSDYILDHINERDLTQMQLGEQTVTYDEMIYSWRDRNMYRELAIIDTAYSNYVLSAFRRCDGLCGGICGASDRTCNQLSNPNYPAVEKEIDARIENVVEELKVLYDLATETNDEYNEYLGCQNISVLSTASVAPNVDVGLYSAIAFIFLMIVLCGGAIVLGRFNDIIEKSFYTDHVTKLRNRAYFDGYLRKKDKSILDDGTVIASVRILNQREINDILGRKNGDLAIQFFADELRKVFARVDAMIVYNGNSHFVAVMEHSDYITMEGIMQTLAQEIDNRDSLEEVTFKYNVGIAETFKARVRSARKLLLEAISSSEEFVSEAKTDK